MLEAPEDSFGAGGWRSWLSAPPMPPEEEVEMSVHAELFDRGLRIDPPIMPLPQPVELFGHVTLVEGYAVPSYVGCHALVALRDTPGKTIAVMTSETRLQSLLETALSTANLIAFWGSKLASPPTPRGGTWAVDVYAIDGVILYSFN